MRRIVFGALAGAAVVGLAGVASAQSGYVTYGQPTVQDYRYAHGGQVVTEVRGASYAATGAWADGRSGYGYAYESYGGGCSDRCGGRHPAPPRPSQGCHDPCGGQGYGVGYAYSGGYTYSETSHWSERRGHWGRYQPRGHQDRGGRYGYSERHDPRGYHDRGGYHDDRAPSRGDPHRHHPGCGCDVIIDDR